MIIASGHIKARNKSFDTLMDFFNEAKLMLIMYHFILFTDFLTDEEALGYVENSCMILLIVATSVNMGVVLYEPLKHAKYRCKVRAHLKKARADRQKIDSKMMSERRRKRKVERDNEMNKFIDEIRAMKQG